MAFSERRQWREPASLQPTTLAQRSSTCDKRRYVRARFCGSRAADRRSLLLLAAPNAARRRLRRGRILALIDASYRQLRQHSGFPAALQRAARPAAQTRPLALDSAQHAPRAMAAARWAPASPVTSRSSVITPQLTRFGRPQARLAPLPRRRRVAPARSRPRTLRRSSWTPQLQCPWRPGALVLIALASAASKSLVPITRPRPRAPRRSYDALREGPATRRRPLAALCRAAEAARGARGSCAVLRRRPLTPLHRLRFAAQRPRLGTTPTAFARGPRAPLPAWRATIVPPRRGRSRCVRRCGRRGVALQRFGLAQRFDAPAPCRPARWPRRRCCSRRWRCWRRRALRMPLRRPARSAPQAARGAAFLSRRQ